MKRWSHLFTAVLIAGLCLVAVSCAGNAPTAPATEQTTLLPEFPLMQGATWVYTYIPYQPLESNPARIVTAVSYMLPLP